MSFRLNFSRFDAELMAEACGSGDQSVHTAIDAYFRNVTSRHQNVDPVWRTARQLVCTIVDDGFPATTDETETFAHRYAVEALINTFQIPGDCDSTEWRWSVFYDTLHTVPGFHDTINEEIRYLTEGRPLFGSACVDEGYYGYLTHQQSLSVLSQCEKHKVAFEAHHESSDCIGPLMSLFQFATASPCSLWFGFG